MTSDCGKVDWILSIGYWILNIGYWILDIGYWILDIGYWVLDIGYGNAGLQTTRSKNEPTEKPSGYLYPPVGPQIKGQITRTFDLHMSARALSHLDDRVLV